MSPGRMVAVVIGALLLLTSLGLAAGGATLLVLDGVVRDQSGFVMTGEAEFATGSHAVATESVELHVWPTGSLPRNLLGDGRVTVDPAGEQSMFIGVAATDDARAYLDGVAHATVTDITGSVTGWHPRQVETGGSAPSVLPAGADIWVASAEGVDELSVTWPLESGEWTVVLMNSDGAASVAADVSVGARLPVLGWLGLALAVTALVGIGGAVVLLTLGLRGGGPVPPAPVAAGQHPAGARPIGPSPVPVPIPERKLP